MIFLGWLWRFELSQCWLGSWDPSHVVIVTSRPLSPAVPLEGAPSDFPEGKIVSGSGGSEVWSRFGCQELIWVKICVGKNTRGTEMQLEFPGQALGGCRALGAEGKTGIRNLPKPQGHGGSAFSPFEGIPACSQFSQLALLGTVPSCWAAAGGTSWGRVRVLKAGGNYSLPWISSPGLWSSHSSLIPWTFHG